MILYALVARAKDGAILVESIVSGVEGNFPQISVKLLERIVSSSKMTSVFGTSEAPAGTESQGAELLPDGGKRTFVQRYNEPVFGGLFCAATGAFTSATWSYFSNGNDESSPDVESINDSSNGSLEYYFHLCRGDNTICLCISDDMDVRHHTVNYNFLDDVRDKFTRTYSASRIAKAKAYEMEKHFKIELGKLIYFYNENRNKLVRQDKVVQLLNEVDDLKSILGKNIIMVLEKESKLEALVEQSKEMLSDTKVRIFLYFIAP